MGQCTCSLPSVYHDSGICSLIPRPSLLPDFPVFGHNYAIAHTIQSLTLSNTYTMQSLTPCNTYNMQSLTPCNTYTMQSLTPCNNKREDLCLYVMSRNQSWRQEGQGTRLKIVYQVHISEALSCLSVLLQ